MKEALIAVLAFLVLVALVVVFTMQPAFTTQGPPAAEDAAKLEAALREIVAFNPRDYTHTENLDRLAAHLFARFTETGASMRWQAYEVDGRTYRNVIARYGPEQEELVVVGAHYDSCDPLPAADDNASGVTVLLALAESLSTAKLKRPVELVAYTLEEPPHFGTEKMGSWQHAKSLARPAYAAVSLEMLGFFSDSPRSQSYPVPMLGLLYPTVANFVAVIGRPSDGALIAKTKAAMTRASDLPIWSMRALRAIPGIDFSDHASYWDHDAHAVMITDTAFFRNANYHEDTDVPEGLDFARMGKVVVGVRAAVLAIANE